jgi:23S rRNA (uridine2552-2'-O)-methyltransferase
VAKPRTLHDEFFKKAKADGYAARSAYKLMEIQEKRRLIRKSDRVLDLGCAPGSWLQVVEKLLGPHGRAVGIDLQAVDLEFGEAITTVVGDIYTTPPETLIALNKREKFDMFLSDMAPNTSGHGDDFLSARLCDRVLDLCHPLLFPGGNLLMKILEGEPTPDVIRRTKSLFREAGTTKPKASRDVSREIFIWGLGYTGVPEARAGR